MATIAIVDDDPGLRRALGRLLSTFDYRTETFGSAGEFLLAAETSKLACIVVDINLGDTSGLELVRQLSSSIDTDQNLSVVRELRSVSRH